MYSIATHISALLLLGSIGVGLPSMAAEPGRSQLKPEFDVVSIHSTASASVRSHIANPAQNSKFIAVNVSLRDLMEVAFALPETQISGGTGWTEFTKFDVQAKSGAELDEQLRSLPPEQAREWKRQMLGRLLSDRFKLTVHGESRTVPLYLMVIDKGGPRLQVSDSKTVDLSGSRTSISIKGGNDALAVLAFELSWRLGRPVLDRSGLRGPYRIELTWADDDPTGSGPAAGPSLFTAMEEQLGLKLQPAKAPVPFLVIDHAEKPLPN